MNKEHRLIIELETVPCGVCGSSEQTQLFVAKDYIYGNPGQWPVAQCNGCGTISMNPRIPPDQIGQYYPKNYYTAEAHAPAENENKWKQAMRDVVIRKYGYAIKSDIAFIYRFTAELMSPYLHNWAPVRKYIYRVDGGRVLDIGCGNGQILSAYRRLGWDTYGIEVSEGSAYVARQAGHNITIGELTDMHLPDAYFDAVTMWDALEHIHNPSQVMAEIYRILRPNGKVYLSVPNGGSWYRKLFKDRWFMFTAPLHYFHYSRQSLFLLLQKSGFAHTEISSPLGEAGLFFTISNMSANHKRVHIIVNSAPIRVVLRMLDFVAPQGHLFAIACKS